MKSKYRKIVFWDVANKKMGGVEKIILTMAIEFSHSFPVLVICKQGSTVQQILDDSGVNYERINPIQAEIEKEITRNDLLIIFHIFSDLRWLKKMNPYVLIWNVFPPLGNRNLIKRIVSRLRLKELILKNSIVTMDDACNNVFVQNFKISLNRNYLKIPIQTIRKDYIYRIKNKTLNISYIGRGNEIWKVKPLKKLVNDCATITDIKFNIHIFTDVTNLFETEISKNTFNNIKFQYHIGYWGSKLSKQLLNVSDLHYSMATALLEGAALGIPAIKADASCKDFPANYKYKWFLDDVKNYAGKFIDSESTFTGYTIREIIDETLNSSLMLKKSDEQISYIRKTFSSTSTANQILKLSPKASVKNILKYSPPTWIK